MEMLNIIHLSHIEDRFKMINNQLIIQKIANYQFWEGIVDPENPPRGISRAHKQIVLWAKQEKLSSVMIAEDEDDIYRYFSALINLNKKSCCIRRSLIIIS